jgi:hypothetical protein
VTDSNDRLSFDPASGENTTAREVALRVEGFELSGVYDGPDERWR